MKKKVVLSLSIFVILISIIVIGNRPIHNLIEYDENTTLALFTEDGEKIDQVPSKDSGYTLNIEKSSCTNGSISWDNESWSPVVTVNSETNSRVSCNLYFRETTAYDKCIMEYWSDSTQCNILADFAEEVCPTVDENGNVLVSSAESENGYLCSAPDNYGTSYYYRGNVTNNYVKFAGFYWRIIRVNGDGSIRMIYAGDASVIDALENKEEVLKNGYNDANTDYTQIGISAYNNSINDNAYVGYMYGAVGVDNYEDTHSNKNDSIIKSYIDNWYESVFLNTEYENYLADTLFCNNRTFNDLNSGTGTGNSFTAYRWCYGPWDNNQYPNLTCSAQNDRFTVNDEVTGNGSLNYPIGLVNHDEVVLAGGYEISENYYLYTGNTYWTMTPAYYDDTGAAVRSVFSSGSASSGYYVNDPRGVRSVINLKPNSLKFGDGSITNPYRIE